MSFTALSPRINPFSLMQLGSISSHGYFKTKGQRSQSHVLNMREWTLYSSHLTTKDATRRAGSVSERAFTNRPRDNSIRTTQHSPKVRQERPSASENALRLPSPSPPKIHRHKHMQKLGRQSCTSQLPSQLDFGT